LEKTNPPTPSGFPTLGSPLFFFSKGWKKSEIAIDALEGFPYSPSLQFENRKAVNAS